MNTGWTGGPYGIGSRIPLKHTRAIIDAIHSGELVGAESTPDPVFKISTITGCPHVPSEILIPRNTWKDKTAFDKTAKKLAGLFVENFSQYAASEAVRNAGPGNGS